MSELVMGVHPDAEADLPGAMRELAAGTLDRATFLQRFGHRGPQEMELSSPRWSESAEPPALASGPVLTNPRDSENARDKILADPKLAQQRTVLAAELDGLHDLLALRETAKHYLMMGSAQIRRVLCELDRRYGLNGGVFFLTPDEVPPVLFSDDLEAIGRAVETGAAETLQGVALSAGTAEGIALVLQSPDAAAIPDEPYILVCPSTDPAWLPLFIRAKGLVMETGGVLSHGAIVAREFGLPAVAGIADVHRRIRSGQRLKMDGAAGTVSVLAVL
jgi:pyruvate,water dikinase